MRMIDADKLLELIKEQKEREIGAYAKGINAGLNIVKSIINDETQTPTAYDVDKVVATMDKALIELEDGTNCGTCAFKEVCDDGYDGCIQTIVAVCKSMVKKGGVSDDVCEKSKGGGVDEL